MTILFLIGNLDSGGAERVAAVLINAWVSRADRVVLGLTTSGTINYDLSKEVEVECIYRTNQWPTAVYKIRTIRKLINEIKPTVIISFLPNVNILSIVANLYTGIPLIISERIHPFFYSKFFYLRVLKYILYGQTNAIVCQTHGVLIATKFFNKKKVINAVIPNPCDNDFISNTCKYENKPKMTLLSVGRLTYQKQHHLLITVFHKLSNEFPNWELKIVGSGELRHSLDDQILNLNMQHKIRIHERSFNIVADYQNAHIFAMCSTFEGFPNALMEAMAIGLPCISFDCLSGPAELSDGGKNLLLIEQLDISGFETALKLLMKNEQLRHYYGTKAKNHVRDSLNLNSIVRKWDDLFTSIRER